MATTTQENVAVARRLLEETFGAGRLGLIDELCVDTYVDHDPLQGDHDRDSVKDSIAAYREAFPDLAFTVEDAFGADDRVAVRWSAEGTFENESHGRTADREEKRAGLWDLHQPLRGRQGCRILDAVGHPAVHEEHRSNARRDRGPERGFGLSRSQAGVGGWPIEGHPPPLTGRTGVRRESEPLWRAVARATELTFAHPAFPPIRSESCQGKSNR